MSDTNRADQGRSPDSRATAAGRVAVVTGGASGMGRSICESFAAHGYRTATLDIDGTAADEVMMS